MTRPSRINPEIARHRTGRLIAAAGSRVEQTAPDGRRLLITAGPEPIADGTGVEVHVRLYGPDGVERPIDPHRRFINPPLHHDGDDDPAAALWSVLWDSVTDFPEPDGWRP